jgi:hypothetical protein
MDWKTKKMVAVSRIDTTEQLLIALRVIQLTLQIINHLIVGGAAASPGHLSFVVKLKLNSTNTPVSQELPVFLNSVFVVCSMVLEQGIPWLERAKEQIYERKLHLSGAEKILHRGISTTVYSRLLL